MTAACAPTGTGPRAVELFKEHAKSIHVRTDRLFAWLMPLQWAAGIALAMWFSPTAWAGRDSSIHPHIWAALFLGGAITLWPVLCAVYLPGRQLTRQMIAIGQMLMGALLIHLAGGRIEMHFHIFVSLALLAFYRDWRVLVTASVVVAMDHYLRGIYFPLSIFGAMTVGPYRWLEHTAWVIMEDVFLMISVRQSLNEMRGIAERQASLEGVNERIGRTVAERTMALTHQIAERKGVEKHLKQLQHDNELIFNAITDGICRVDRDGRLVFQNASGARMLGWDKGELIGRPAHQTIHHTRVDGTPYPRHECPIHEALHGGPPRRVDNEVFWRQDGTSFPVEYVAAPVRDEKGEVVGAVVAFRDITEGKSAEEVRKRLAAQLERERREFEEILNNIPLLVFEHCETDTGIRYFINGYVEKMFGYTAKEWNSTRDFWLSRVHPDDRAQAAKDLEQVRETSYTTVRRWVTKDGRLVWGETHAIPLRDATGRTIGLRGITIDITERKKAEAEKLEMNRLLIDASRQAGMAEVATNVLHNVGNVLNSVNISHSLIEDQLRKSGIGRLAQVAEMLDQHRGDVAAFLGSDPIGRKLPAFLSMLAKCLAEEQAAALAEIALLGQNIDHIKEIIAVQQSYAQASGLQETVPIAALMENALQINAVALVGDRIEIIREHGEAPAVSLEKHKVIQILINLVSNAKDALKEADREQRRLVVRTGYRAGRIWVRVSDNGVGIAKENLTRIFAHGFTTKREGHGFGLHASALAAKEMGGELGVESDGVGMGATFWLELPAKAEGQGT